MELVHATVMFEERSERRVDPTLNVVRCSRDYVGRQRSVEVHKELVIVDQLFVLSVRRPDAWVGVPPAAAAQDRLFLVGSLLDEATVALEPFL